MYSTEQRKLTIETYVKFDLSAADTIAELGYPTRHSLRAWHKDHLGHGGSGLRSGNGSPSSPWR